MDHHARHGWPPGADHHRRLLHRHADLKVCVLPGQGPLFCTAPSRVVRVTRPLLRGGSGGRWRLLVARPVIALSRGARQRAATDWSLGGGGLPRVAAASAATGAAAAATRRTERWRRRRRRTPRARGFGGGFVAWQLLWPRRRRRRWAQRARKLKRSRRRGIWRGHGGAGVGEVAAARGMTGGPPPPPLRKRPCRLDLRARR